MIRQSAKHWGSVVGWNIAILAGLLALLELALRFTSLDAVRNPYAAEPPHYYLADESLGARISRNFPSTPFVSRAPAHDIFSNELGCFDHPFSTATREPYILAIGDSFTWGYNPLDSKWTSIVERALRTRVLKCGMSGTGTRHQLASLKRLLSALPYPPRLVIHLYDTTDFNDDYIFPGESVVDGRRIDTYEKIRLSDGHRMGRQSALAARRSYAPGANPLILTSLVKAALTVRRRTEKRRWLLAGGKPEFLHRRYEFNLLLLDPADYPLIASTLEEHIATLGEIRRTAKASGTAYALFHTNSFRLPAARPLVRRLDAAFESMPEFLGRMPDLDRHAFDPHWNPDSEAVVAARMLSALEQRNIRAVLAVSGR